MRALCVSKRRREGSGAGWAGGKNGPVTRAGRGKGERVTGRIAAETGERKRICFFFCFFSLNFFLSKPISKTILKITLNHF